MSLAISSVPGMGLAPYDMDTCLLNESTSASGPPEQGRTQPRSQGVCTETTLHYWLMREWKASQKTWKELLKRTKVEGGKEQYFFLPIALEEL